MATTVEFRLLYQGPLKANSRPQDKHAIRRVFHAQFCTLWDQVPLSAQRDLLEKDSQQGRLSILESLEGFHFAPLICEKLHMVCALDIIMLRPEPPGHVVTQSGDIDNRLKTLFDSLRMPKVTSELPTGEVPCDDEDPFFCLLEDDNLITKVTVETDRLLTAKTSPNDVLLVIHVKTNVIRSTWDNMPFAIL